MSRKPSPIPLDKALYDAVVAEAKRRFKWPSRNASWWVSGEYKRRGGVYAAAPRENPVGEDQRLTYAHDRHDGPGPDALAVVTVDGEYVRKNIDTDFTMGGNPSRYAYVPHGELWVEETLGENDTISTIVHEAIEHRLMANVALSYEDAHAAANEVDESLRAALDDDATDPLRLVVKTPAGSFAVVVHLGDEVFDPNNVEIALVRPRKNPRREPYSDVDALAELASGGSGSFDDYYERWDAEDLDPEGLRYGRKVVWQVTPGRAVKIDPDYVVSMPENIFDPDKLAAIVDAVQSGEKPVFDVGYGTVRVIGERDVAESQDAFERGETMTQRPLDEGDVGKLLFTVRDGNHRVFGALIAGERHVWMHLSDNDVQDVREWRRDRDAYLARQGRFAASADARMQLFSDLLDEGDS